MGLGGADVVDEAVAGVARAAFTLACIVGGVCEPEPLATGVDVPDVLGGVEEAP